MTPPTLNIKFKNTSQADLYASITGKDLDNNSQWFLLKADGKSAYHPELPSQDQSPLTEDCSIKIGGPGAERTVTIPHLGGGRIYFSLHEPVTFLLNRTPALALVEPSVTNTSDKNYNKNWGFCEFTFDFGQLYANVSYVDFVGLPVAISLENDAGEMKKVLGMPPDGLDKVCKGLQSQAHADGQGWDKLIVDGPDGKPLRILSPNQGCVMDTNFLTNYFEPYVDKVWERFTNEDITIDTMAAGILKGRVIGDKFVIGGEEFSKPTTRQIFSASGGPFQTGVNSTRDAIIPRLDAEFNRSTLMMHIDMFPGQPDQYYMNDVTNHYARLVHAANTDHRGYAHPYDDASPRMILNGFEQSGFVNDPNPALFSVIVGGGGASM